MKLSFFGTGRNAVLWTGLTLLISTSIARADSVYTSGGFEPPTFLPTLALDGQNGWTKDAGSSTATISTNSPRSALQSVQILKAANSTGDTRWAIGTAFTPTTTLNALSADVDLRVNLSAFDFGPAFGLEFRDGSKLVGAFSLDAATGKVLYVETGTGRVLSTGKALSRGAYHHFQLTADFANRRYLILVDDALVRTEPFINSTVTEISSTSIAAYSLNPADAAGESGVAYLDNLDVTSKHVEPVVTAPAAPANLTARGGKSQILLQWEVSNGAATYNVYRGTAPGAEDNAPLATGITSPAYTDGGLPDGATYYYKVSAVNSAGESAKSNEASAKTAPPDLLIQDLTANPNTPGVGDSVVLRATVANDSGSTTANGHSVTFYDGGTAIGTASVDTLAPGTSTTVQTTWIPQNSGTRTISAQVSALEGEEDTANNTTTLELTVYNYYTYIANGSLVATGSVDGNSQNKWYKYNVGVPMSVIKEVRVIGQVSSYDDSASAALGEPSPYLESYTGDGKLDLARVGAVMPTGPGNWVMSSQSPAVAGTIKPMTENYVDLYVNGLNATDSAKDQIKVFGVTVQIKYLAP